MMMQLSRTMHRRALSSVPAVSEIKTVGVVGMGLMGHGIAQASASARMNLQFSPTLPTLFSFFVLFFSLDPGGLVSIFLRFYGPQ